MTKRPVAIRRNAEVSAPIICSGKIWPNTLTDAAVEIFESEKNNREQRRKKREARKKKEH